MNYIEPHWYQIANPLLLNLFSPKSVLVTISDPKGNLKANPVICTGLSGGGEGEGEGGTVSLSL